MPKLKTKKALVKRFRITKGGKILRRQSGKGHLLTHKSRADVRDKGKVGHVAKEDEIKVRKLLRY